MKFEECYLDTSEESCSVEKMLTIYNQDREEYKEKYYQHMYCPECHDAELSFHPNAITAYFSTKTLSALKHDPECSYNYKTATKKQLDEYYKDDCNYDAIKRKLNRCLDLLLNKPIDKGTRDKTLIEPSTPTEKTTFTFESSGKRVSIRRKKITVPLDEAKDYGLPILFYGTVKVKWDKDAANNRYIRLTSVETNKLLCSIKVTNKVYEHLTDEIKATDGEICNIAFMGEMTKYKTFNNCTLKYSSLIIIEINNHE